MLSCLLSCGFIENSTMRRPILVSSLWSLSAERQRVELLKRADERRLGAGCGSTKVEVDEVFDAESDMVGVGGGGRILAVHLVDGAHVLVHEGDGHLGVER